MNVNMGPVLVLNYATTQLEATYVPVKRAALFKLTTIHAMVSVKVVLCKCNYRPVFIACCHTVCQQPSWVYNYDGVLFFLHICNYII